MSDYHKKIGQIYNDTNLHIFVVVFLKEHICCCYLLKNINNNIVISQWWNFLESWKYIGPRKHTKS